MASIYRRGQVWWIRYYVDGKKIRESLKTKSRATALQKKEAIEAKLTLGLIEVPEDTTLSAFLETFLAHQDAEGREQQTIDTQRMQLGRFVKHAPVRRVADVRARHVSKFLDSLDVTPATKNRYRAAISRFLAYAIEQGIRQTNPARQVKAKREPRREVVYLTEAEREELLALVAGTDLEPAVALGVFAGLRRREISELRWKDVDLGEGWVVVPASIAKSGKDRAIPIVPRLHEILERAPRRCAHVVSHLVGKKRKKRPRKWSPDGLNHAMARLGRELGLPKLNGCHVLRRTFGTHAISLGIPLAELQELMGHVDPNTTMRYARFVPGKRTRLDLLGRLGEEGVEDDAGGGSLDAVAEDAGDEE